MNLLTAAGNIISTARNVNGDSEEWYLFNKDDQGSTKSIIDDGGNRSIAYEYDEYGNITSQHGEGIDNEVGYTGQIFDESTGLYYYNARFYDPETGSFTTQDTYRGDGTEPTTLNYYTYCAGDPVNYTDPTGHSFLRKAKKKAKRLKKKAKRKIKKIKKKASKVKARVKNAVKKAAKNAKRAVRTKYGQAMEYIKRKKKQAKDAYKKAKAKDKGFLRKGFSTSYRKTPIIKHIYKTVSYLHFEKREQLNGRHPTYDEVNNPNSDWRLMKKSESLYHDNGDEYPEKKYVNSSGREAVFKGTKDGYEPMTDPEYIATYNYIAPYDPADGTPILPRDGAAAVGSRLGHLVVDVLPYYLFGKCNTRLQFEK